MVHKGKTELTPKAIQQRALAMGAKHAKIVNPREVFTAAWVRLKCQYGCGAYGSNLLCPPHSPTPDATRKVLDGYEQAILIHGDRHTDMRRVVSALEREAFLAGHYKAFGFASGPCSLCDECALEEGCRRPEEARPAMEACGIDVFLTARTAGLPIEVVKNRRCEQNYYSLLLLA